MLRLACLLAATTLFAADTSRLALMDEFQLELATDPQISPDGKRVVYVRQFADVMGDRRHSNLWIVNYDGTDQRPLTTGNFNDSSPRWSPDGTQLIYISNRDGSTQIYRRWMDTGQVAKITNLTQPPSGLAWSPDGKSIAFVALVPGEARKIAKLPAPPEGAKWADPARVIDRLVYRFNGAGYLKPGYWHVFVVPAEGGTPRQVSTGNYQHGGPAFRASDPVWSADAQSILISANRHDNYELEALNTDIYEFRLADGNVKELTSRNGPDGQPAVSPDGSKIAYTGFDDQRQGYQVTRLYVMNRDGSASRPVPAAWDRDVANVRWAPDGSGVYFTSDDKGDTGLYFMTPDGQM